MWQEFLPSRSPWVGSDILHGSCICNDEGSEVPSSLSLHLHGESGGLAVARVPHKRKGPQAGGWEAVLWPQPLQGGHRASSQPTAASFPEQEEGAERLRAGQAGGFPAAPTPRPHPFTVCSARFLPGQRSTYLLLPLGPETSNESSRPRFTGKWGRERPLSPSPRPRPAPKD